MKVELTQSSLVEPLPTPSAPLSWIRNLGIGAICFGALLFIAQQWGFEEAVSRTYTFAASLLILLGNGLLCGLILKEEKSARAFIGVVGALLPALAVTIGGAFSDWYTGGALKEMDLCVLLLMSGVLLPLGTFFFLSTMARPFKGSLSPFFLTSLALLLPPERGALWTVIIGSVLYFSWEKIEAKVFRTHEFFSGATGRFIRVVASVPWVLFLARGLIYNAPASPAAVSGGLFLLSRACLFLGGRMAVPGLQELGCLCLLGTILPWVDEVKLMVPFFSEVSIVCLLGAGILSVQSYWERSFGKRLASVQSVLILIANAYEIYSSGNGSAAAAFVISLLGIYSTWKLQSRTLFAFAQMLTTGAVVKLLYLCVDLQGVQLWISFVTIGISLILLSALLERYRKEVVRFVINPFGEKSLS